MVILYNANGKDIISVFKFPENYTPVPDVAWGILGHEEIESKVFPEFTRGPNGVRCGAMPISMLSPHG